GHRSENHTILNLRPFAQRGPATLGGTTTFKDVLLLRARLRRRVSGASSKRFVRDVEKLWTKLGRRQVPGQASAYLTKHDGLKVSVRPPRRPESAGTHRITAQTQRALGMACMLLRKLLMKRF